MPETSGDDYFQKHPLEVLYRERCPLKFPKIHRKIPFPESESCNLIKKEILTQVFSCKFCENFKNPFFYRAPLVAASVLLPVRNSSEILKRIILPNPYRTTSVVESIHNKIAETDSTPANLLKRSCQHDGFPQIHQSFQNILEKFNMDSVAGLQLY